MPLETTFAIFLGGMIRWMTDKMRDSKNFNDAQKARVENAGVLTASGFIAGEALMGIVIAIFKYKQWPLPVIFAHPNVISGFIVLVILASRDDARAAGERRTVPTSRLRRPRSCRTAETDTFAEQGAASGAPFSLRCHPELSVRGGAPFEAAGVEGPALPCRNDPSMIQTVLRLRSAWHVLSSLRMTARAAVE